LELATRRRQQEVTDSGPRGRKRSTKAASKQVTRGRQTRSASMAKSKQPAVVEAPVLLRSGKKRGRKPLQKKAVSTKEPPFLVIQKAEETNDKKQN